MASSTLALTASLIALAACGISAAAAQTAPATTETASGSAPDAEEAVEDIIITGSSIRGVPPTGSALIAVGREAIEESSALNTTDILRETPQVLALGVNDSARSTNFGGRNIVYGNAINLRGISPYATLTLFNGHRWVPMDTVGGTSDPGFIPGVALERVEIVADGASGVYGSDAVTGVANLILRRKIDGLELKVQNGVANGYREFLVTGAGGFDWGSGRVTLSYQHSYRSRLSGLDRDWYGADLRSRGVLDYRLDNCAPGNLVTGGRVYPIPVGGATPQNLVVGSANLCDIYKVADLRPQMELNSGTFTFDQELGDSISVYADGFIGQREGNRRFALPNQVLTVPRSNAFFVAPAGTNPASVQVRYSFANDFPVSEANFRVRSYQVNGGARVKLGGDWGLDINTGYGWSDAQNVNDLQINPAALVTALADSNPATAFNPFGRPNSAAALATVSNFGGQVFGSNGLTYVKAVIDGTLVALPGGPLKIAVGAEYNDIYQRSGQSQGPLDNVQNVTDNMLRRKVKSVFAELAIPLFGPDNAIPGIQSLDLSLAGRIDDYDDVGTTKNPKTGVNWEPLDGLRLHGSYSTSFRAPLLTQIISPTQSLNVNPYFDPTANGGAGATINGIVLNGSNLDLVPETSRSWSLGFDYRPSAISGAVLSVNYFDLIYRGQVNSFSNNRSLLLDEDVYAPVITRNPSRAYLQSLLDQGLAVLRGTPADVLNTTLLIDGRSRNLGTTITSGLDIQVTVPIRTENAGDFRFNFVGAYFLKYDTALTQAEQPTDRLNQIDTPQRFRFRSSIGWSLDAFNVTGYVNYINGYRNNLSTLVPRIGSFTSFDLDMSVTVRSESRWSDGFKFGINVDNLFNQDPPFADYPAANSGAGGGFDASVHSPVGRLISVYVGKKF